MVGGVPGPGGGVPGPGGGVPGPGVPSPRGVPGPGGGCLVWGAGPGGSAPGWALVETPWDGYCRGQYASYWNAFLLPIFMEFL